MVADGIDDCEGDLISRVREIVGPNVPVGVELDLHCHFTKQMFDNADAIVGYKEYPHTDGMARMLELARIVIDAASGKVKPAMAVHDCRMVGLWHTTREPMAGFVRRMIEAEQQPGVLSVSLGHGFPWADVPESGAKLWVVTDNDPVLAQTVADRLGKEFWELRNAIGAPVMPIEQALKEAFAVEGGPVVLADVADNAGGGATSDSTFILKHLLDNKIGNAAFGAFWDLGAIHLCRDAGIGARFELRVGGKCGPSSGDPVDVTVTVRGVEEKHSQTGLEGGTRAPLGCSVWVQTDDGIDIVLISRRSQTFAPDLFTGLGIDLLSKKLIVVKSAQHFYAAFSPIAKKTLYVTTPAGKSYDFATLPYKVRDLNYWPRLEQPTPEPTMTKTSSIGAAPAAASSAPGEIHTVEGRQMHLQRSGPAIGSTPYPTLVLEAGAGCASTIFGRVQHELSKHYSVVSYDRPGYGWSEAIDAEIDAKHNARLLNQLLQEAGVTAPIMLIGHSLGGLLARVYTGLYPDQVVGVVMLDASHPDQNWDVPAMIKAVLESERSKRAQYQADGVVPAELQQIAPLFADIPHVAEQLLASYKPAVVDTMLRELQSAKQIAKQAAEVPSLGDRPLAVLWAAPTEMPGAPEEILDTQRRWPAFQQAHAGLSTRSTIELVPGAAHMTILLVPPFVQRITAAVDTLLAREEATQ